MICIYKLIIIDDEHSICNGLCNYFPWEHVGFEVAAHFDNGKEALQYVMENKIHAVLTDIRMPVMDGIEFARQIAEKNLPVKIVFLSGYKDFEYAKNAIEYGVRSYILKPAKYSGLFETFTKVRLELDKEAYAFIPGKNAKKAIDEKFSVIDSVKIFVANNVRDITLEKAAEHCRLNPYYLSSLFHQQTGEKFYDYVLRIKMEAAARLLMDTNDKIHEISLSVGYANANSFSRAFKNYYNINPKEYRSSNSICTARSAEK